jgi:hypothetical protein
MKNLLFILVASLLAGVAAFSIVRYHKVAAAKGPLLDSLPELAWVKTELKLSEEQFARVSALHVAYRPKCVEYCQAIAAAHEQLVRLTRRDREVTPELAAAIREHAEVHAKCQREMLRHLYETAAALNEQQASRYLEVMLPFALDSAPDEPENPHCH